MAVRKSMLQDTRGLQGYRNGGGSPVCERALVPHQQGDFLVQGQLPATHDSSVTSPCQLVPNKLVRAFL